MSDPMEAKRRRVAAHEAGHAVVAHAMWKFVTKVEITPAGDWGACWARNPRPAAWERAYSYAGWAGEILLAEHADLVPIIDLHPEWPNDTQSIAVLDAALDPAGVEAARMDALRLCVQIIRDNEACAEGLIGLLVRRLVLPGRDVRDLFRSYDFRRLPRLKPTPAPC